MAILSLLWRKLSTFLFTFNANRVSSTPAFINTFEAFNRAYFGKRNALPVGQAANQILFISMELPRVEAASEHKQAMAELVSSKEAATTAADFEQMNGPTTFDALEGPITTLDSHNATPGLTFIFPRVDTSGLQEVLRNAEPQSIIRYDGYEYDTPTSPPSMRKGSYLGSGESKSPKSLAAHDCMSLGQPLLPDQPEDESHTEEHSADYNLQDGDEDVLVFRQDQLVDYEVTLDNDTAISEWIELASTMADPNAEQGDVSDIDGLNGSFMLPSPFFPSSVNTDFGPELVIAPEPQQKPKPHQGKRAVRPPPGFENMGVRNIPSGQLLAPPPGFETIIANNLMPLGEALVGVPIQFSREEYNSRNNPGHRPSALTFLLNGDQAPSQLDHLPKVKALEEPARSASSQYSFRPGSHLASDDSFYLNDQGSASLRDIEALRRGAMFSPVQWLFRPGFNPASGDFFHQANDDDDDDTEGGRSFTRDMQAMTQGVILSSPLLRQSIRSPSVAAVEVRTTHDHHVKSGDSSSGSEHNKAGRRSHHGHLDEYPDTIQTRFPSSPSFNCSKGPESVLRDVGDSIDALATNLEKLYRQLARDEKEMKWEEEVEEAVQHRRVLNSLP